MPKPFAGYYSYAIDERWGLYTWKEFFVFCYSALFGMLTHVVWDAFTHNTGYFVMKIPLLQREWYGISVYKYMQHGSTCIGVLLLVYVLWKYRNEMGKDLILASEKKVLGFSNCCSNYYIYRARVPRSLFSYFPNWRYNSIWTDKFILWTCHCFYSLQSQGLILYS